VFDPGCLLVVRVGNLNECETSIKNSRTVENPLFHLLNLGCLVKNSLAKTLLREKRPVEEKKYTQGYNYSVQCSIHLTKVEFEVGHIPSVGYLFPR